MLRDVLIFKCLKMFIFRYFSYLQHFPYTVSQNKQITVKPGSAADPRGLSSKDQTVLLTQPRWPGTSPFHPNADGCRWEVEGLMASS
jgi:hypothetical protein